jgi:inner membrane protein
MENLTHSLIGATLAELFVPRSASPAKRGFFFTVGVVAANLPDADLIYTRITAPPLGYLLHHRGHTHTLVGAAVLGAAFGLLLLIPRVRRGLAESRGRFWGLVACASLSHIVADSWNWYGVHPFWPFENRWYYGDIINIYEPWLWLILGVAVALNTHARGTKLALVAMLIALPLALTGLRMMSPVLLGVLAACGALWTVILAGRSPKQRAGVAAIVAGAFVLSMVGLKGVVRSKIDRSLEAVPRAELLDAMLSPRAANPLCWSTILLERDRAADSYTLRRGTLSVIPGGCSREWKFAWAPADTQSLSRLRYLSSDNCRVGAWLRFGRAPYVRGGRIADYRFGGAGGGNFSSMLIDGNGADCPANVPPWEKPRRDLIGE